MPESCSALCSGISSHYEFDLESIYSYGNWDSPWTDPNFDPSFFLDDIIKSEDMYDDEKVITELQQAKSIFDKQTFTAAEFKNEKITPTYETELNWRDTHPFQWSPDQVLDWIYSQDEFKLSALRGERFQNITGHQLCSMSADEFILREPIYGSSLYERLHLLLLNIKSERLPDIEVFRRDIQSYSNHVYSFHSNDFHDNNFYANNFHGNNLASEIRSKPNSYSNEMLPVTVVEKFDPVRRGPGQPRKIRQISEFEGGVEGGVERASSSSESGLSDGREVLRQHGLTRRHRRRANRSTHLWEFMRALLHDARYNPECIKWENQELGVFRIVPGKSKVIARLWGERKKNCTMTFDKLSRSLRWCRSYGFLSEVPKDGGYPKKLCFRFGEKAEAWNKN